MTPYRGQVIRADAGLDEPNLFLVVSNNRRNRHLPSVLTVRLTTTSKRELDSIVVIPAHEAFSGRVLCDDIGPVFEDEIIGGPLGALSPSTMAAVDRALAAALGLT